MKACVNLFSLVAIGVLLALAPALAQEAPAEHTAPASLSAPAAMTAATIEEPAAAPVAGVTNAEPEPPAEATPAAGMEPAPAEVATETNTAASTPVIEVPTEEKPDAGIEVVQDTANDNRISVTLDNVPLQDVIRMFTRISGANIVSGTNLAGSVTVNLQDVEWEPALRVILDSTGNALVEKTPGIYTIVNKSELASEPVTSDTLFLNFATVSNILPLVQSMLVSSNAKASAFSGANAIVIQETVPRIKTIRDVIARVDRPRDQVLIEAKFVELNDEAIKDVGIDWSVLQGYTVSVTPQFQYGKNRTSTDTSNDTTSDRNQRTVTDRRTSDDTQTKHDVTQDAYVTYNDDKGISGSSAVFPGGSVSGSDTSGSRDGTINVSGQNFSDYDPLEQKLTLIPRQDNTAIDRAFKEDSRVRTLDDLATTGDQVTKTTTEVLSAVLSAEQFALTLSALKQNNGVEIVSNPKVVVASGETATIHVGRNEPNIVAVPQGDTGDRYAYQLDATTPFIEIGVKLNVTPTYNTESNINVRITPELSRKLADKSVGESGTTFPVTQVRKINTEFNLESGRTVAIGGLTESDDVENIKKVPVLGDIPIIGKYFFRHTHTEKLQDEVIIFVTVTSARPNTLAQISGIPQEGRLIHRHLAQRAEEAAKAEQLKTKKGTSSTAR